MKHPILVTMFAAATTWSAVPVQFTAGQAAKAADVNQNFSYVDSVSAKKANRTSLDSLGVLIRAKADTGAVNTADSKKANRTSLDSLGALVKAKADTGTVNAADSKKANRTSLDSLGALLKAKADTGSVTRKVSDTATALRALMNASSSAAGISRFVVQAPGDILNNSPWYGLGLSDVAGGANFQVQLAGYYGINFQAGGFPIFIHQMEHEVASFNYDETYFSIFDKKLLSLSSGSVAVEGDLSVTGAIYAPSGSVKVPDYVFEPGYKLAPLSAVEAYTRENKHLPEVPAAAEIEKGGMNLAQMNLTLLKKVEELTLHAIAQEKRLESQDRTIAEMKSTLESLKSR